MLEETVSAVLCLCVMSGLTAAALGDRADMSWDGASCKSEEAPKPFDRSATVKLGGVSWHERHTALGQLVSQTV